MLTPFVSLDIIFLDAEVMGVARELLCSDSPVGVASASSETNAVFLAVPGYGFVLVAVSVSFAVNKAEKRATSPNSPSICSLLSDDVRSAPPLL